MTPDQITASIEALRPAPAHETMRQIAVRAAAWLLSTIADQYPAIAETHALYVRAINDGGLNVPPTEIEWWAIDLARNLDLARATLKIAGSDRIKPLKSLNRGMLAAIESHGCALNMGAWHGDRDGNHCDTTHCRAGWAIALHPLGLELEAAFGSQLAGSVIYLASTGSVPNFFADTETAMQDIRECAAREAAQEAAQ
jgi:hypothetical protein